MPHPRQNTVCEAKKNPKENPGVASHEEISPQNHPILVVVVFLEAKRNPRPCHRGGNYPHVSSRRLACSGEQEEVAP